MWTLADNQAQLRSIAPNIIDDHPDEIDPALVDIDLNARRPFIYNDAAHVVHIGKPGEYHSDVRERHGLITNENWGHEGYIWKGSQTGGTDQAGWINPRLTLPNKDQVLQSVAEYQGVAPEMQTGYDFNAHVAVERVLEARQKRAYAKREATYSEASLWSLQR